MAPTYTITAADVADVSVDSALTEGTEFDWGSTPKKIRPPASVAQVDAQWIVDNCRFAEATHVGMTRPPIITASGKIQTGTNPATGDPQFTSITPVLQDDWVVETQKISGVFLLIDILNPTYTNANGVPPYINVSGVDIRYTTTRNGTIQQVSGGSGGLTSGQAVQLLTAATQSAAAVAAIAGLNDLSTAEVETAAIAALTNYDAATAADLSDIQSNIGLILQDAEISRKGVTNRHLIDATANTGTLFDDDGETPLYVFDLKDAAGSPASEQVYERDPR
ncbi:MAG: hypothetical protein AAFO83_00260 [Cyanobacteria bacterium J06607_13]